MIRVFEVPDTLQCGYCFFGGHSYDFKQVDWMSQLSPLESIDVLGSDEWRETVIENIRQKKYFSEDKRFLVLGENGESLTIGFNNGDLS